MTDDKSKTNGGRTLDLNGLLNVGDLMFMIDSLSFAATRARFCDGDKGGVEVSERLREIVGKLKEMSPLPKGDRTTGFEWFFACRAASTCSHYGVYLIEEKHYNGSGVHMEIVCDDTVHRIVTNGDRDEIAASLQSIREYIRDIAPVSAEPLTVLKGLVDLPSRVAIEREDDFRRNKVSRFIPLTEAMRDHLASATPFVHIIDAKNFWGIDTVVEARFAVPVSSAEAVFSYVAEMNSGAIADYRAKYQFSSSDFGMTPAP